MDSPGVLSLEPRHGHVRQSDLWNSPKSIGKMCVPDTVREVLDGCRIGMVLEEEEEEILDDFQ